jgi:hypothetical protein
MIKWLGENGGELVGTNKYLCVQKKDLCVQIRFLCRLHKGCSGRGSRMLCLGSCTQKYQAGCCQDANNSNESLIEVVHEPI